MRGLNFERGSRQVMESRSKQQLAVSWKMKRGEVEVHGLGMRFRASELFTSS